MGGGTLRTSRTPSLAAPWTRTNMRALRRWRCAFAFAFVAADLGVDWCTQACRHNTHAPIFVDLRGGREGGGEAEREEGRPRGRREPPLKSDSPQVKSASPQVSLQLGGRSSWGESPPFLHTQRPLPVRPRRVHAHTRRPCPAPAPPSPAPAGGGPARAGGDVYTPPCPLSCPVRMHAWTINAGACMQSHTDPKPGTHSEGPGAPPIALPRVMFPSGLACPCPALPRPRRSRAGTCWWRRRPRRRGCTCPSAASSCASPRRPRAGSGCRWGATRHARPPAKPPGAPPHARPPAATARLAPYPL